MTTQQAIEATTYPVIDKTFLQLRLDMQSLHKGIKEFLEGKQTELKKDEDSGQWYEISTELGKAYANHEGIQNLFGTVITLVNEHTVVGNLKDEAALKNFLQGVHEDLTKAIHRNWLRWEIEKNNREFIIDRIMALVELVLSRTIEDGERKSLNPTTIKRSTFSADEKKGIV